MQLNKTVLKIWTLQESEIEFEKYFKDNFIVANITACGNPMGSQIAVLMVQQPKIMNSNLQMMK